MKKLEIGTKVFDFQYGHGKIYSIHSDDFYVYGVEFENGNKKTYSKEGFFRTIDKYPTLSLTEYTLEKGGFTPIDSEPPLQKGELAYFWDGNEENSHVFIDNFDQVCGNMFWTLNKCQFKHASREIPQFLLDKQKEFLNQNK